MPNAGDQKIAHRPATPADLEALAPLFDAYRMFYDQPSDLAAARAFLAERLRLNDSVILVAIHRAAPSDTGAVVGFAQLYPLASSVRLGRTLVLNDLYVAPAARGRGAGALLVDACIDYAQSCGALSLQLETHPDNEAALRLYRAKGFVMDTEFAHLSLALKSLRADGHR